MAEYAGFSIFMPIWRFGDIYACFEIFMLKLKSYAVICLRFGDKYLQMEV